MRPASCAQIVLATNIAETAVTIDDVVCVVNSGRLKEKNYDPYTAVATLQAAWISRASERQRCGRAGRCQPVGGPAPLFAPWMPDAGLSSRCRVAGACLVAGQSQTATVCHYHLIHATAGKDTDSNGCALL